MSENNSRQANKRGVARLAAVQALYQMDLSGAGITDIVAEFENLRLGKELDGEEYLDADAAWFRGLVAGVVGKQAILDPVIHKNLPEDWPLSRIDILLRAVLRGGSFELMERQDVPARVVITEYVEIAKAFFDSDEPRLVNAVLDAIGREVRKSDFKTLDAT